MTPSTEPFVFTLQPIDWAVIVGYLLILIGTGIFFRRLVKTTKDYFIGGNRVSWWFAGMSAFMMCFSAWTFTGAAGLAYENGILAIMFFWGNALAFLFNYFFIAKKIRHTRVVTAMEIIRERYGKITEQVITWIQVPQFILGGAIWLTGLSIFLSVGLDIPMQTCIIVSGIVIITYSTLGGSWAVVSTDFFQSLLLLVMVCCLSLITLFHIGGVGGFVERVDPQVITGFSEDRSIFWLIGAFSMSFLAFTSVMGAPRYLSVKDGDDARKVALLASILFFVGPIIWFIPPMAATYFFPDMGLSLSNLNHPQEGAYLIMGLSLLPHGLIGLLLMNIFGATLSTMDTAMNQSSGIITLNVYRNVIRPQAKDRELFIVAHAFNLVFGIIVISLALLVAGNEVHGLFDINLYIQGLLTVPIAVPLFLIYFVRRTPWWSAVIATLSGISFSFIAHRSAFFPELWPNLEAKLNGLIGQEIFIAGEIWPLHQRALLTILVCLVAFFLTRYFWRYSPKTEKARIQAFYDKMDRPVDVEGEAEAGAESGVDARQFFISGVLMMIAGVGISVTAFFNSFQDGRGWINLCMGAVIIALGAFVFSLHGRTLRKAAAAKRAMLERLSQRTEPSI
jgi:SSS family transporter